MREPRDGSWCAETHPQQSQTTCFMSQIHRPPIHVLVKLRLTDDRVYNISDCTRDWYKAKEGHSRASF